jgi:predicted permease
MRFPLWRRRQDEDLEEEFHSHLRLSARDRIDRGESPAEADASARREFGNILSAREDTRDTWGWTSIERLLQDLRYGVRVLLKSPAFTAIAVLTLTLGIGANTALFSVVSNVLLSPLPFPHPNQLVAVDESKPNFARGSISFPNFRDWRDQSRSFSGLAVYRGWSATLTGTGDAVQVNGMFVSADFFSLLGVRPILGRTFVAGEDEIGAAPLAILSESLWKRRFDSAPDLVGKGVTLDGRLYTIVGVVPGAGDIATRSTDPSEVFLPIGQWNNPLLSSRSAGLGIHGLARLRPGVTLAQARDDMERVTSNLASTYPAIDKGIGASLTPLKRAVVGRVEPVLLLLQVAVLFVLLIACVNVANLLLARSSARHGEFATRAALGAGRMRILRQLLTESLLLASIGGGLGLLLAAWATRAALTSLPVTLPRSLEVGLDYRVLLFTAAITLFAGIAFGVAPALRISRSGLSQVLQESGRSMSGGRFRTLGIFVVVQIAMALVLLVGAGLMLRSFERLWNVNPGFDPDRVLTFGFSLPPSMMHASPDAIRAAFRQFDENLAATPGVRAASVSWGAVPLAGDDERLFWVDGKPKPASEKDMSWALNYVVGPDYLRVMKIPLQRGRFFSPADDEHAPLVAAVDSVFAAQYFPGQDPVGQRLHIGNQVFEIIGVVGHVKQWGLDSDDTNSLRAQLYTPFMQLTDQAMRLSPSGISVLVRYDGTTAAALEAVKRTSRKMSAEQVVFSAETMDQIVGDTLASRRVSMLLLAGFALLALTLACGGLYGVVSYVVAQRTHEIGLRMALGADRSRVLTMILAQGAALAGLGVAIGVVAALGLTRLMSGMLYGVRPSDPLTFAAVAALLAAFAIAASWLPARRAVRVDPMIALRHP